jgi:Peptidase family M28
MSRYPTKKGLFLIFALWLTFASGMEAETSPADSITATKIRDRIYYLTAEALEGRYPGSQGFRIAAEYAASQFRAAGLLPIIGPEGQRSYFQPVPLAKRTVQEAAVVTLRTSGREKTFAAGNLKLYLSEGLIEESKPLPVVFAGFGISEPKAGWDDLKRLDIAGKVVIVMMGAPTKDGEAVLPADVHKIYVPLNSILRKCVAMREAAFILILPNEELRQAFDSFPAIPEGPGFVLDDKDPGAYRLAPLGFISDDLSQAIFAGQGLPGPAAVSTGRFPPGEIKNVTIAIRIPFRDEKVQTWNVLGLVEGTDPALRDQVVVVTAHLDHLPPTPDGKIQPGANDNASGAAALLEIAGAVASHPPLRSVLFVLFGAEEGGAMGSRYFLARGPVSRDRIVADINMDMIGRTEEGLQAERAQYALDSGRIYPAFAKMIEDVNSRTVEWPLRFEHPLNLGDSDHRFFEALGIPAVNFYTGRIPDTHKPTDTPEKLDYEKAAQIARLVHELTMELASRKPLWK